VRSTENASARWAKDLRTFLTILHHLKAKTKLICNLNRQFRAHRWGRKGYIQCIENVKKSKE
jgi:hypothetical protein